MKNARIALAVVLICFILSFGACVRTPQGGGSPTILPDDVTATYGAQLFHQQLTAQWISRSTPQPPPAP
ncbi:MAG: hypothetical protein ACKOC5_02210 [Chloroflexota bacterium]